MPDSCDFHQPTVAEGNFGVNNPQIRSVSGLQMVISGYDSRGYAKQVFLQHTAQGGALKVLEGREAIRWEKRGDKPTGGRERKRSGQKAGEEVPSGGGYLSLEMGSPSPTSTPTWLRA